MQERLERVIDSSCLERRCQENISNKGPWSYQIDNYLLPDSAYAVEAAKYPILKTPGNKYLCLS